MGHYIKDNLNDITYKSELIPPAFLRKQEGGINSYSNLCSLHSISCVLIYYDTT